MRECKETAVVIWRKITLTSVELQLHRIKLQTQLPRERGQGKHDSQQEHYKNSITKARQTRTE